MGAGTQIVQTFGETLQPNTKYTITFDCYMSAGAPAAASINGALCYGTGPGSGSAFAGYIDAADIQLGTSGFSAALANTPISFTATFTTGASIVDPANNLGIFINPGIIPGAQIILDNVQVTAEATGPFYPPEQQFCKCLGFNDLIFMLMSGAGRQVQSGGRRTVKVSVLHAGSWH
jgi:hypothetical protein